MQASVAAWIEKGKLLSKVGARVHPPHAHRPLRPASTSKLLQAAMVLDDEVGEGVWEDGLDGERAHTGQQVEGDE
jgi:hypothetical protein